MLAQRLLVDLELIGDFGLSEAESRGALNERALYSAAFSLARTGKIQ
jgi:hypothetical protein